jgi:3-oxoacyl-[acyl-carrier protein] reductase
MQQLTDQVAVVTGGARGIGRGIATVLAAEGARVVIVDLDGELAERAASDLGGLAIAADVVDRASVEQMAARVVDELGRIDIVAANAGIYPVAELTELTDEMWAQVMDVNVGGAVRTVQACLPAMRDRGYGRVVLTSSITGPITGFPGWSHYGATKAGQLGFMRTACIELAKYGITVNAVMPGNIVTEGLVGLGEDYQKTMAASIPLKRLGTVEDIGYAALYFASKEAGYVTGQTIIVDGGQILPESLEALA